MFNKIIVLRSTRTISSGKYAIVYYIVCIAVVLLVVPRPPVVVVQPPVLAAVLPASVRGSTYCYCQRPCSALFGSQPALQPQLHCFNRLEHLFNYVALHWPRIT